MFLKNHLINSLVFFNYDIKRLLLLFNIFLRVLSCLLKCCVLQRLCTPFVIMTVHICRFSSPPAQKLLRNLYNYIAEVGKSEARTEI